MKFSETKQINKNYNKMQKKKNSIISLIIDFRLREI